MARSLPSRSDVLKLLATDERAFHAKEIAKELGVEDSKYEGLMRLLDNLSFDGAVLALDGASFKLMSKSRPGRPLEERGTERPRGTHQAVVAKPRETPRKESSQAAAEMPKFSVAGSRSHEGSGHKGEHKGGKKEWPRREQARPQEQSRGNSRPEERSREASRPRGERPGVNGESTRQGIVTVNARGFGFVSSVGAVGDDVFVPAEALRGAMHGDTVKVSVTGRSPRGSEGEVVEIVTRGAKRVSGVLRRRGKSAWLEPDDTRVRGPIVLPEDIDSRAGEGNSGKDGDAAIVIITRWPDLPDENPEGKLEVVLGRPGELSVEVAKILAMAQIEEIHSAQAFAEAEAYGPTVPAEMLVGRQDLTHLPLPTIDPEDARDHDDAVWVERAEDGGFIAWIAIADVSSYVRPGTEIDVEAKRRGCSVYLPDRAIPMLPRPLSSNLCSLLPDVVRLCLCVEVHLDASGKVLERKMIRGFMKSQAKLTYGGVARALGFTELPPHDPKADELIDGLRVANELSKLLRGRRMKRGALDFDLPEAKIILGEDGNPTDVQKRSGDPGMKKAYSLIEELMLLANEVVAEWLLARKLPTIFRIHEAPDDTKLGKLGIMCKALGVEFDMEHAKDPKLLSAMLKRFADHPMVDVLNMLLLRAMKQAAYEIHNLGHFGLASKAYLHFTSPIRRYPDLVVHRSVHAAVLGQRIDTSEEATAELAEAALAASGAERRSMEVERNTVDLYRAILMRDRVGERFEGRVTALVGSGVFVVLDDPFVDVMVKLEDLGAEQYVIDDDGLRAVAARSGDVVTLGDRMLLEIIDVGIQRRTVYGRRIGGKGMDSTGERRFKLNSDGKSDTRKHQGKGKGKDKGKGSKPPSRDKHGLKQARKGKSKKSGGGGGGGKKGKKARR